MIGKPGGEIVDASSDVVADEAHAFDAVDAAPGWFVGVLDLVRRAGRRKLGLGSNDND